MATKEQIRREFFATLLKGSQGVAVGDAVIPAILIKDLYKKYQYELSHDEFDAIGDELENEGYFSWNADGLLAVTAEGLAYLDSHKLF